MSQTGDYDKSIAQAHKALYLMVERRCPATPQNYELWYNYATGHDRSLVDQVDGALDNNGALAQAAADKIYDENLSPVRGMENAMEISGQVTGEVSQVLNMLEAAQGETSAYGDSLGTVSQELSGASDSNALNSIVQRLLESTKKMEDNNRHLEERLQASHRQIADLSENLTSARQESRTDQLTGISNRKAFDEMIKKLTGEAIEENYELCMLIGDIDHFKKFNDTYGHQTGDQVLKLVAGCLTSVLKGRDFAARYGGEEFVVLLPETDLEAAQTVGDHIRKTVMSKKLIKKSTGENLGVITMSFGGAKFKPGESIDQFVSRADKCLYAAKDAGRNQVKCETDPALHLASNAA